MVKKMQEYEKAIQYIYDMMQEEKLSIGDRLPTERTIAEHLSISRNSTREAISILHGMGMIERRQGSGNYISGDVDKSITRMIQMMLALNSTTKEDVCSFRRHMDKAICSAVMETGVSVGWKEEMVTLLEEMDVEDRKQVARVDKAFHLQLIAATRNQFWITVMEAVVEVYRNWIDIVIENASEEIRQDLLKIHKEIFHSIVDNDMDACMQAIDVHYDVIECMISKVDQG